MIKVAFLFDRCNDWLAQHFPEYFYASTELDIHTLYDEKEVRGYDIVFVLGYTKLLKGEILEANNLLLVVHESDLPKGRGFAPVQWQILEGFNSITVCLIRVFDEADTGDICEKMTLSLSGTELYDEIRMKQAKITFKLIEQFLKKYPNINFTKQKGEPSIYKRRTPSDSQLDVDKTIREQFNLLRISNNEEWPAFFEISGQTYQLKIEKLK